MASLAPDPNTHSLRPEHRRRFRPQQVRSVIRTVLASRLREDEPYNMNAVPNQIKEVADAVRDAVTRLDFKNYKILVHVMIGEQRGEGVRMGCKCFWDADTDNLAEEVYITKHIFAVCTVYGVYQY